MSTPTEADWARVARARGMSPPTASDSFLAGFALGAFLVDSVRSAGVWMNYSRSIPDPQRLAIEGGGFSAGICEGEAWFALAEKLEALP